MPEDSRNKTMRKVDVRRRGRDIASEEKRSIRKMLKRKRKKGREKQQFKTQNRKQNNIKALKTKIK